MAMLAWNPTVFALDLFDIPTVRDEGGEAWLVTFAPGQIYWERFGHNAIWLREPAAGLDHTFNFGFFDFEQEDFLLRFLRGNMLYFSVAQASGREFEWYRQQNRSIRIQRLNLTSPQYNKLRDYLLTEIQPENRDYRYDYYLNNCSTRIRDALDYALDGSLSAHTQTIPANLNFRDHTRRLTEIQFWYYLGLEMGLGFTVDRGITRWDEMFIPMVVADELQAQSTTDVNGSKPLVDVDYLLFDSGSPVAAVTPTTVWHRYLLLGLLVTGFAWLSGKILPPLWLAGLCQAWVLINVTVGLVLTALWLFTDHQVTRLNANLLLLDPLLVMAWFPVLRRIAATLLAGGTAIAYVLLLLPQHQYNLDVLALLTPINLAVALYFFKKETRFPTAKIN